jgi:DNA ligase (NAD+)
MNNQDVLIFQADNGEISVEVHFSGETAWLSLTQIAVLFERDKSVISRHLKKIFEEGELESTSTVANFATVQMEGGHPVERQIDYYNLDVIISVGYRVNSKRGTQFRRWASTVLKDYLIKGYAIDQKKLTDQSIGQIRQTIELLSQTLMGQSLVNDRGAQVLNIIRDYAKTWDILLKYDENWIHNDIQEVEVPANIVSLKYEEAIQAIDCMKKELQRTNSLTNLFGQERAEALKGILGNLEQTFDGKPVYASLEKRAAHLLYFIIKDHPFSDGNKRLGSLLFLLYLQKSGLNLKRINDNGLIALALLVAESAPSQKDFVIQMIISLLKD